MKENILPDKSYKFALRIIKLYKYMVEKHKEYILSKQILESGASIGANDEDSIHAQSRTDFVHTLSISQRKHQKPITG